MNKKFKFKKLSLNKETLVTLSNKDMKIQRAGADATDIGVSCYTSTCCKTYECPTTDIGVMVQNP